MGKLNGRAAQLAQSTCVVRCCPKQDQTSFFRIPAARRDDWIRICGLDPTRLNTLSRVCNLHFTEDDYCPGTGLRKRLRKDVVPSQWVPVPEVTETAEVSCQGEKAVESPQMSLPSEQSETQHVVNAQEDPPEPLEDHPDNLPDIVDSLAGNDQELEQDSPGGPLNPEDLVENLNNSSFDTDGKFITIFTP